MSDLRETEAKLTAPPTFESNWRKEASSPQGACTYDFCTEGEGGGCPISDQRKGGCVDLVLTKGREGVQNLNNLADVICASPLA